MKIAALLGACCVCALAAPVVASTISLTIIVDGVTDTFTSGTGVLTVTNALVNGVSINTSVSSATNNPDVLTIFTGSIVNTTGTAKSYEAVLSADDFVGPVSSIAWTGSGSWLQKPNTASSFGYSYWADPSNRIATSSTPLPGTTVVGGFTGNVTSVVESFSQSGSGGFTAAGPFSMINEWNGIMAPGAELLSRGQAMVATVIPETSTWGMLGVGFTMLGGFGWKKRPAAPSLD